MRSVIARPRRTFRPSIWRPRPIATPEELRKHRAWLRRNRGRRDGFFWPGCPCCDAGCVDDDARPDEDISNEIIWDHASTGPWDPEPIWSEIDEWPADDATSAVSVTLRSDANTSGDEARFRVGCTDVDDNETNQFKTQVRLKLDIDDEGTANWGNSLIIETYFDGTLVDSSPAILISGGSPPSAVDWTTIEDGPWGETAAPLNIELRVRAQTSGEETAPNDGQATWHVSAVRLLQECP